jgi:hypothetical protein
MKGVRVVEALGMSDNANVDVVRAFSAHMMLADADACGCERDTQFTTEERFHQTQNS